MPAGQRRRSPVVQVTSTLDHLARPSASAAQVEACRSHQKCSARGVLAHGYLANRNTGAKSACHHQIRSFSACTTVCYHLVGSCRRGPYPAVLEPQRCKVPG